MRLITRSDFDGLACAAILKDLGVVDQFLYAHPKDIQDKKVPVTDKDVLANVPFVEGCGLWFDHHSSEHERLELEGKFEGASDMKPSTARVIADYYKDQGDLAPRLNKFHELLDAVDKADSAQYTADDIVDPKGWMMLAFIADPRTDLGYRHDFRISNFDLMKTLPELLATKNIDEILAIPDFQERIDVYHRESNAYQVFLKQNCTIQGKAIIIDLRNVAKIPSGNRFIEYTLFPEQNISVRVVPVKSQGKVMISVGHSIINRSSNVDVGSLLLKYGGGGHTKVGTCQVPANQADQILEEITQAVRG